MDLADAAFGDPEDLADLTQGEVLDVEQHGDLAIATREGGEGAAEALLGLGLRRLVQRVGRVVLAEDVDALDARAVVGENQGVQGGHVGRDEVLLTVAQLLERHVQRVGEL